MLHKRIRNKVNDLDYPQKYVPYSRAEKDLGVFGALCKLILSFFQTVVTGNNDEVGYNGKAVIKMFAEMISVH